MWVVLELTKPYVWFYSPGPLPETSPARLTKLVPAIRDTGVLKMHQDRTGRHVQGNHAGDDGVQDGWGRVKGVASPSLPLTCASRLCVGSVCSGVVVPAGPNHAFTARTCAQGGGACSRKQVAVCHPVCQ